MKKRHIKRLLDIRLHDLYAEDQILIDAMGR